MEQAEFLAGKPANARRIGFGNFRAWIEWLEENLNPQYGAQFIDLENIQFEDFDVLVPLQIDHYTPLRRRPDFLGRKFLLPSERATTLCDDKLALTEFLIAEGFAQFVPRLRAPGPPYPYVWKKRRGWWGLHCHVIKNAQDEAAFDLKDESWFAQDLVPGEHEITTHILRANGAIRYASSFGFKMATLRGIKGAIDKPVSTGFVRDCPYLDLFSKMLQWIGYEGTVCFDYKIAYGQPLVLEINPRFGSSLCWDINAYLEAYISALTQ